MTSGTQISDMTIETSPLPAETWFPFVVTDTDTGLLTTANYRYDLGTDLLTRVSYAALAASDASSLIGHLGPQTGAVATTVKAAIDATGYMGNLSTSARLQAAIDYVGTNGGTLILPPGAYALTSQVTLTPTALKNIHIIGYGAEITTTGAISGLKISDAEFFPHQIVVEGIKINHRGNADATAGFELVHSSNVTIRNCTVEAHGTGASYAAGLLKQSNTADENTGCLWCTFDNFTVRPRSGLDGAITYGIRSIGYNNMLRIIGGAISATTGISITTAGTAEFLANAVVIDGAAFEGGTTAISVVGKTPAPDPTAAISGLRIVNNRAEALTNFLSLTGSTVQPVVPPFLAGNYLTPDVTNYIVNTNSLRVFSLDGSTNSPNAPETYFGGTWLMRNTSGSGATLDVEGTATGTAVQRWLDSSANVLATMKWETGGVATLQASGAASLNHTGVRSISQTTTAANNLRGTVTVSEGNTTATHTFSTAEPDGSYNVVLTALSKTGSPAADSAIIDSVSCIAASFTVTVQAAPGVGTSRTFNWQLIR